ncbi:STAS/SEC14 domain-containing protein [Hymenobacter negativus]|uniref:STAS/SEC14 domain-containing protein n=1 Tax=Hymenobacter negativus TaxID=2795026 RepID=A0ABS3QPN0_9BACT|nr:STAS/SEC14 domain-containing protein [Hymenobacter negativus]MBO2012993.1 hypothetical protein [Hymenobacter negativus]
MNLLLLQDTPIVSVYFDTKNNWLFSDWRGNLSLAQVQAGCLTIAQCFLERTYPRILNNNTDLTGMSPSAPPWLARDYLPHLGLAGIEYLAWVCAPSLLLKHLTGEAVRQLRAPTVATFDHLADAYAWLQNANVTHPGDMLPHRTPAQQAELNRRIAQLSDELQHYDQIAGRSLH